MERIDKVILHCSASDVVGDDDVERIRHLHTAPKDTLVRWKSKKYAGRGFSAIGYHFIITRDGKTHFGRPVEYQGAHCYGQNQHSIGICLTGNRTFSLKQFKSLFVLLEHIKEDYGVDEDSVFGHYYFDKHGKTCPNFIL